MKVLVGIESAYQNRYLDKTSPLLISRLAPTLDYLGRVNTPGGIYARGTPSLIMVR